LEAAARSAQAGGDDRTLDQLRADILSLMGHTALELGYVGLPPGTTVGAEQPEPDGPATPTPPPADSAAGEPLPDARLSDEPPAHEPGGPEGRFGASDDAAAQQDEPAGEQCSPDSETPAPLVSPTTTPTAEQDPPGELAPSPADLTQEADPAAPDPPDAGAEGTAVLTTGPPAPVDPPRPPGPSVEHQPMSRSGTVPRRWHMPVGHIGGQRAQIRVLVPLSVLLPADIAR